MDVLDVEPWLAGVTQDCQFPPGSLPVDLTSLGALFRRVCRSELALPVGAAEAGYTIDSDIAKLELDPLSDGQLFLRLEREIYLTKPDDQTRIVSVFIRAWIERRVPGPPIYFIGHYSDNQDGELGREQIVLRFEHLLATTLSETTLVSWRIDTETEEP